MELEVGRVEVGGPVGVGLSLSPLSGCTLKLTKPTILDICFVTLTSCSH